MVDPLETLAEDEPVEYTLAEFLPLAPLRHLPKILKEPDPRLRYMEISVNAVLSAANVCAYLSAFYGLLE